jgi:hypothetical protein
MKLPVIYNGTQRVTVHRTRYPELCYCRIEGKSYETHVFNAGTSDARIGKRPIPGQPTWEWRFVTTEDGATVGPYYETRAELLADLDSYARFYGCHGAKVHQADCQHAELGCCFCVQPEEAA